MKQIKIFLSIALLLVAVGLLLFFYYNNNNESLDRSDNSNENSNASSDESLNDLDFAARLAKALNDSGMVLYCSKEMEECKSQIALFGEDSKYLDYVECDSRQPEANVEECGAHQIDAYPTWIYQKKKTVGVQDLASLAEIINLNKK